MSEAACRSCGHPLTDVVADLGSSPLANSLPVQGTEVPDPVFPLVLLVCSQCLLVQLEHVQTPDVIFRDYLYTSSQSSTWLQHVDAFASAAVSRIPLGSRSQVLEVASNDGHLLDCFLRRGVPALGVEPAENLAAAANARGLPTIAAFFGATAARQIVGDRGPADLVIANNVLAHVPDLHDFIEGLRLALGPAGAVSIEWPHVGNLLRRLQFDTIYHEHYSYFSLTSLTPALAQHALRVFDVERLPTHGGSVRIWACHSRDQRETTRHVEELLTEEASLGLDAVRTYTSFGPRVRSLADQILDTIRSLAMSGSVRAYGAPAKATTLLNYCKIEQDLIDYTVDASPLKQGRAIPGVRIPIYEPRRLLRDSPEVVFVLAWNLLAEIAEYLAPIRQQGASLMVYQPELRVIGPHDALH